MTWLIVNGNDATILQLADTQTMNLDIDTLTAVKDSVETVYDRKITCTQAYEVETASIPEDFAPSKYKYIDGEFVLA
jgi:hypothetical protein